MFWSILHRTILWELVKMFLLSLVGIMSILILAGIVAEASQQGLKPSQILAAIPLLVPSFLPYTIPATTLFATCVVYGRLAHDNEILAIKAAGVNLLRVIWPAILLGMIMSAVTMGLYYRLIPYTHYLLRAAIMNDVEEYLYDMLKRDHCIRQPKLPYAMWVRQVQGTRLVDALFKRLDAHQHYDVIAQAREAELRCDMANHQILVHMRQGEVLSENGLKRTYFKENTWPVPFPTDFGVEARPRARALSWEQLVNRCKDLEADEAQLQAKIRAAQKRETAQQPRRRPVPSPMPAQGKGAGNLLFKCGVSHAAGPLRRLPLLRAHRLSDRHLVQPQRLPQRVHYLLPAHRVHLLSTAAVQHQLRQVRLFRRRPLDRQRPHGADGHGAVPPDAQALIQSPLSGAGNGSRPVSLSATE